jgi:hypothetical protein
MVAEIVVDCQCLVRLLGVLPYQCRILTQQWFLPQNQAIEWANK